MKRIKTAWLPAIAGALLIGLAGCITEREKGQERAILKAGQQVSYDMVGWVAVPNTVPEMRKDAGKNLSYAVISSHNVVPEAMNGWAAISAKFFAEMTDIKVDAPPASSGEKWVLKPEGKSVPKDKNGWVAVPFAEPEIAKSSVRKGREAATLATNQIVPKEMHGWVAVDNATFAKLVYDFMQTGPGSKANK